MAITVRPAQHRDAAAIAELHVTTARHAFAKIFPSDAPVPTVVGLTVDWERRLGDDRLPHQVGLVAEDADLVVGVIVAGPDPDDAGVGHLSRLYVRPSHWGRGIGRLLYERAIGHLRQVGYRDVTLWVLEDNQRARRWYETLGWRETPARKPTYAPAGIDDIGYHLTLDSADP